LGDYSNLVLKKGTNIISWTGNVERVIIENVSRWI
jgi:phage-related protein